MYITCNTVCGTDPSIQLELTVDSCNESGSIMFKVGFDDPLKTSVMYTCYNRSTNPVMVSQLTQLALSYDEDKTSYQ